MNRLWPFAWAGLLCACGSKPDPIVYLDNGTAAEAVVAIDGLGERRIPAGDIMKVEVKKGARTLTATMADGAPAATTADLEPNRRYVFNIGGKNAYAIFTVYYTPQGQEAETATNAPPERLGEGQAIFAFPSWMRRDLNERPPEKLAVKEKGEYDVKYVFHKPIHRDRACCGGVKHLHWTDEVQAATERLESAVFQAQQDLLQEQAQPETPVDGDPE